MKTRPSHVPWMWLLPLVSLLLTVPACSSPKPLTLRHFSRNVIVSADRRMHLDTDEIDFRNLRSELVQKHLVSDDTPVTVHIHHTLPPEVFDFVVRQFRKAGFRNVTYTVYRDGPALAPAR